MNHKLIKETDYLNCIRCGLCLSVCPTYREYLTETASPRGRVALARKGLEKELELSQNLYEQMYACFDCLACRDVCPVGISAADLALKMRAAGEADRPSGWKKWLFGRILPKSKNLERATWLLRLYERSGVRRLYYFLGIKRLLPEKLRDLEAMLPHLPVRPFRAMVPEYTPAVNKTKYRVGFFLGCAQNLLYAEASRAAVRVLSRNGCSVLAPKDVQCCGVPAMAYGRREEAIEMAKKNIEIFSNLGLDVIVTDCATCGANLKSYHELLDGQPEWGDKAGAFVKKVKDISEFLAEIPLKRPAGRLSAKVTYHDPCHLRRGQNVWQQPRRLLQLIDGITFTELPESDWCCGSAGSQLITHHETSVRVLDRKMDNLESTGAEIIATGCPGCQMQLNTGIARRKMAVSVLHPVVLLDQAYEASE